MVKTIKLDASAWKNPLDFYAALLASLGAPEWHGRNVNALMDSMIWGGINEVDPPYKVEIRGTKNLPAKVIQELNWTKEGIAEQRAYCRHLPTPLPRDAISESMARWIVVICRPSAKTS